MSQFNADVLRRYEFVPGSRNPRMPPIYNADDHPLHPPTNPGRSYVVKIRPTIAAMQEQEEFERGLEIPNGRKEELDAAGEVEF